MSPSYREHYKTGLGWFVVGKHTKVPGIPPDYHMQKRDII